MKKEIIALLMALTLVSFGFIVSFKSDDSNSIVIGKDKYYKCNTTISEPSSDTLWYPGGLTITKSQKTITITYDHFNCK